MESNNEKEILIEVLELYKSCRMLWDSSQALYHNKDARNQAFAMLLEMYQRLKPTATLKDVKRKLENMRSTYKKELKKVKESLITGTGAKEEYVPTLWYYEHLQFLDEKEVVRQGRETLEEEEESPTNVITEDTEDVYGELEEVSVLPNPSASLPTPDHSTNPSSSTACNPSLNDSRNLSHSTGTPIPPKRAKMSLRKKQDELIDAARTLLQGTSNQFETFGASVAQQLQTLQPTQQAIAQKLISDVLFFGKLVQLTPAASVLPSAFQPPPPRYLDVPPEVPFRSRFSQPYAQSYGNTLFDQHTSNPSPSSLISIPASPLASSSTTPSPSPRGGVVLPRSHQGPSTPAEAPMIDAELYRRGDKTLEEVSEYLLLK